MKDRLARYKNAIENSTVDEYHRSRGRNYSGLNFCLICGLRKIYVVFDVDGSILKATCANRNCRFLYNPHNISIKGEKVFVRGRRGDNRYERREKILRR
jgi:hypothetical protein